MIFFIHWTFPTLALTYKWQQLLQNRSVWFVLTQNVGVTGNATKQVFAPAAIALAMLRHESLLCPIFVFALS